MQRQNLKTESKNYNIFFKSLMTHSFSGSFVNLTEFTRFIVYISWYDKN